MSLWTSVIRSSDPVSDMSKCLTMVLAVRFLDGKFGSLSGRKSLFDDFSLIPATGTSSSPVSTSLCIYGIAIPYALSRRARSACPSVVMPCVPRSISSLPWQTHGDRAVSCLSPTLISFLSELKCRLLAPFLSLFTSFFVILSFLFP